MKRDIDYAATAVAAAITAKFSASNHLQRLAVFANERTISVCDGANSAEGTRDDLLAAVRKANTYAELWQAFADLEQAVQRRARADFRGADP